MRRFIGLAVALPLAVVLMLLALANRGPVTLSFDPFSGAATALKITLPLFALLLLTLMLGVAIGGVATWLGQGRHRRLERQYKREADRLKTEAERLKAAQPSNGLPAIR
jgi:uncharacterized integral membrane protein